jgi:hypothetical protein
MNKQLEANLRKLGEWGMVNGEWEIGEWGMVNGNWGDGMALQGPDK